MTDFAVELISVEIILYFFLVLQLLHRAFYKFFLYFGNTHYNLLGMLPKTVMHFLKSLIIHYHSQEQCVLEDQLRDYHT